MRRMLYNSGYLGNASPELQTIKAKIADIAVCPKSQHRKTKTVMQTLLSAPRQIMNDRNNTQVLLLARREITKKINLANCPIRTADNCSANHPVTAIRPIAS